MCVHGGSFAAATPPLPRAGKGRERKGREGKGREGGCEKINSIIIKPTAVTVAAVVDDDAVDAHNCCYC